MGHLCKISLHVVRQCIHSCGCGNKRWKFHGQKWISKDDFCQELGREKNFFLVCFIVSNDRTASHFTPGACGCRYSYEMRDIIRNIDLSLIHISEPTRLLSISYAVFCL